MCHNTLHNLAEAIEILDSLECSYLLGVQCPLSPGSVFLQAPTVIDIDEHLQVVRHYIGIVF